MDPTGTTLPSRRYFTQSMSLLGRIENIDGVYFSLRCRSGDMFRIKCGPTTNFTVLQNMDDLDRDRVPNPPDFDPSKGTPLRRTNR